MSLWPVWDKQAAKQMRSFYTYYGQGMPPVQALRKAQLERIAWMQKYLGGAPRVVKKLVRPLRRCAIIVVEKAPESFAALNGLLRRSFDRLGKQQDIAFALVIALPIVMHERLPERAS